MIRTQVLVASETNNYLIPGDDRIFLGEGLFETLKVVRGRASCPYLHWQRLNDSAQKSGIPFDINCAGWMEHLEHQIHQHELYDGGIKAILSGGSAPRGLIEQGQINRLMFQVFNYTPQPDPLRLISASWARDAANPVYQVKSVNYLEAVIARRQALAAGADDALFFNLEHHATETTCANLFLINQQQLITPPLGDGVLPGITRGRILTFLKQQEIPCVEASVTRAMLTEADAVFTSNSLQGIRAVCSIDRLSFAVEHPLFDRLNSFLNFDNCV